MSSRQLRKIQKQKELQQLEKDNDPAASEDESEDEGPGPAPAKPRVSLFAALGGDDEDGDDEDKDGVDDADNRQSEEQDKQLGGQGADEADDEVNQELEQEAARPSAKKSKKKKKKAAKKKTSNNNAPLVEEAGYEPKDQDDEIDRALEELKLASRSGGQAGVSSDKGFAERSRDVDELLQVNAHHLKAINEMRSLFGKEAIESAAQEEHEEQVAELRRHGRQGPRQVNLEQALRGHPQHRLPEISLRRNAFVQGREWWPRANAAGLTMKEVRRGTDDGQLTEFAFDHDEGYDKTQVLFFHLVQAGEPMNMVSLLRESPYHVTTLLQVSKIAAQDQNPALAAELCERALFTFGRVTTSAFRQRLEQGKARLDFRRPENREFWLAGYHYLKSLIRKGTYRTALEWAKLLYSLNPNDPYAMKNFLHPLALRARQAQWLVDFCESPAFLVGETDDVYVKQSVVLAKLQLGDADGARDLLVRGMERLPWLYCALFQELGIDPPPPIWGVKPQGDSVYWTNIYIHQAKDLWDNSSATSLLKEAVKLAQKVEVKALPPDGPSDLRTARFAFLEGNTKLIAGVPRHILSQQPNYEFDPLPPPLAENVFTSSGMRLPWAEGSGGRGDGLLDTPQGRAFFNRMRQQMERAQQRGGAGVGGGAAALAGEDGDDFGGDPFDVIPDDDEDEEEIDMNPAEMRRFAEMAGRMPGGGDEFVWDDDDDDENGASREDDAAAWGEGDQTGTGEAQAGGEGGYPPQGGLQRMLAGLFGSFFGGQTGEAQQVQQQEEGEGEGEGEANGVQEGEPAHEDGPAPTNAESPGNGR